MIENVELCAGCPIRGLCVGAVSLDTQERVRRVEGGDAYTGVAIVATDSDGISNKVIAVVPTAYSVDSRRGPKLVETTPLDGAVRSDEFFKLLSQNPSTLLEAIKTRAAQCETPHLRESDSAYAVSYQRVCRAAAPAVLGALVKNEGSSS